MSGKVGEGKGTWGKLGDEMELPWVDPRDPNYDSDTEEDDDECRVYYETLCSSHTNDILDNDCKRIPVRLCAQGCVIQEGEMKCKRTNNPAIRKIPLEKCEIKPQTVCRKLTKLVPKLIAKVKGHK